MFGKSGLVHRANLYHLSRYKLAFVPRNCFMRSKHSSEHVRDTRIQHHEIRLLCAFDVIMVVPILECGDGKGEWSLKPPHQIFEPLCLHSLHQDLLPQQDSSIYQFSQSSPLFCLAKMLVGSRRIEHRQRCRNGWV